MVRYGFGDKTGETEKGGLTQYQHGHLEVSGKAFKYASSQYPSLPPAGAIGLVLAVQTAGVDLSEFADSEPAEVDYEALSESLQELDGIGESLAESVLDQVREVVGGA